MESIVSSWITPLHTAAAEGRCDQLNLLLEYEEVDINIQTKLYNDYEEVIVLNNTPLHLAIENRKKYIQIITDNTGETPLIVATKNGFSQTMKILLESGAHIFTRDKRGLNALDYAFSVNEKSVQDEQVFDQVLSTMLNNEPKETAQNSGVRPVKNW